MINPVWVISGCLFTLYWVNRIFDLSSIHSCLSNGFESALDSVANCCGLMQFLLGKKSMDDIVSEISNLEYDEMVVYSLTIFLVAFFTFQGMKERMERLAEE